MKTVILTILAVMLTACGGASDEGSATAYYFEYRNSNSSYAVYGPYPSLSACATARSRFSSINTTGCHL